MGKYNFKMPATLLCDFYKVAHREQYPDKTEVIFSTWTPRTSRIAGITEVVHFGLQGFVKEMLIDYFNDNFFNRPKQEVVDEYVRYMKYCLFKTVTYTKHIEELHDLGYLPISIRAVDEGTAVPIRVPMMVTNNTDPRFFWLVNYMETINSCELWQPSTDATLAKEYRKILDRYAMETVGNTDFVQYQGHDFSMRGMAGWNAAAKSGSGHLLYFVGTDTIPAIGYHEAYYNANIEKELVGCSVPATEHSVMCAGGKTDEYETYRRLIEDVYPAGIVSIVSDTWDLWYVLTVIILKLKDAIMKRDGKVVIRPDSGDPVDILCGSAVVLEEGFSMTEVERNVLSRGKSIFRAGSKFYSAGYNWSKIEGKTDEGSDVVWVEITPTAEMKGVVETLWDIFGGTLTEKGYKLLDSHIGAIYGDSITLERAEQICSRLKAKGFASINVVLGIGSYTYQYNTRDTFGFAMKSTHCVINGEQVNIFKDPVTDDGVKKSQTGRVVVLKDDEGKLYFIDGLTIEQELEYCDRNLLTSVFFNGQLLKDDTLAQLRERISNG